MKKTLILTLSVGLVIIPASIQAIELGRPAVPLSAGVATTTAPLRGVLPATISKRAVAGVTCAKTITAAGCNIVSCSDGTTLNTCEMCSALKPRVLTERTPPQSLLVALAKPRVATTSVRASEPSPAVSWWKNILRSKKEETKPAPCTTNDVVDGQCTLTYDCKKDLQRYACPEVGLGGEYTWTVGWCTYATVGYSTKTHKAQCSVSCEKDPYASGPSWGSGVSNCPSWMQIPDKKPQPGANDEYCKENPNDTFICNPSAG